MAIRLVVALACVIWFHCLFAHEFCIFSSMVSLSLFLFTTNLLSCHSISCFMFRRRCFAILAKTTAILISNGGHFHCVTLTDVDDHFENKAQSLMPNWFRFHSHDDLFHRVNFLLCPSLFRLAIAVCLHHLVTFTAFSFLSFTLDHVQLDSICFVWKSFRLIERWRSLFSIAIPNWCQLRSFEIHRQFPFSFLNSSLNF